MTDKEILTVKDGDFEINVREERSRFFQGGSAKSLSIVDQEEADELYALDKDVDLGWT